MNAKVTWQEGLLFEGSVDLAPVFKVDGNPPVDGLKQGASPMQLVAVGLVGCTAMDVISILQKMRQDVTDFEVSFEGERADEHPKVFTHIKVEYVIHGRDIDPEKVEKAINLSSERYCSVQAMLQQAATIEHSYRIVPVEEVAEAA